MEKDEILARELQNRERRAAAHYLHYQRASGPFTWPPEESDSDEEQQRGNSPPIMETLGKKVSQFKEGFKSTLSSLTSSITQALAPPPPVSPRQPVYAPLPPEDDEDKELISSSDSDDLNEGSILLTPRKEKRTNTDFELSINTS